MPIANDNNSSQELRSQAVEQFFDERKNFIIIGLTGRTGSGCSTISNLLTKSFDELQPPMPIKNGSIEDRQYYIVYNYTKANWDKFIKIEMKHIILSFILENSFSDLQSFINKIYDQNLDSNEIEEEYNNLHQLRLRFKEEGEIENRKGESVPLHDDIYNFYFYTIPEFFPKFKELVDKIYIPLMQKIGNNIRASGHSFNDQINPLNIFKLSQRVNMYIKMLRKKNLLNNINSDNKKTRVLVVIDAFRNPYEAIFFKDRYSSFYLFSVDATYENRRNNLFSKDFSKERIEELDKIEYPKRNNTIHDFYTINIEKTIEIADVHLRNEIVEKENSFIKKQIIRYISLIMHPSLVTPTNLERCMQIAYTAKLNSGCISRQVGAVVTDNEYTINSVGWNCAPSNQVPCNVRNVLSLTREDNEDPIGMSAFERTDSDFRRFLKNKLSSLDFDKLRGRICSYCFKDAYNSFKSKDNQVFTRSIHAEEMAFLHMTKNGGQGIKGGFLFSTASPCELCSKKASHLGIRKIYYIDQYPGISDKHIIQCGENHPEMELFHGAIGRAYNQFYIQVLPYKDELYMLLNLEFEVKKDGSNN